MILAANHRSFLDPFVIGCCLRRPIYFVAKRELFDSRLLGWVLNCLGAFPVRRGESDEEAMATALTLLERGEAVVIFPEGTRNRSGPLAEPQARVGRLALQSGAPVVPIAVKGTERARRGWRIRPVRVDVRCGRPLTYPRARASRRRGSRTRSPRGSGRASSCSGRGSAGPMPAEHAVARRARGAPRGLRPRRG